MQADMFLRHLQNAMPSRDVLEDYGLDDDEIVEIQATFTAESRETSGNGSGNEIERLVLDFDCSRIEVGLLRFSRELSPHSHGVQFANCEADPVVVKRDGAIAMFNAATPDSKEILCAIDSERFLDALAAFVDIRTNKSDWKGRVDEASAICADAAGGSQYREFFQVLCGFLH